MFFGDPKRFAIQFALDQNYCGPWLYGKVCYWLSSKEIGDYDLGTSLRDVLFEWQHIRLTAGKRTNNRLLTMESRELVRLLNCGIFGPSHCRNQFETEKLAGKENWHNHKVMAGVDVFDGWRVYLIEDVLIGRCITHKYRSKFYDEYILSAGEFDNVLADATAALLALYENEDPYGG